MNFRELKQIEAAINEATEPTDEPNTFVFLEGFSFQTIAEGLAEALPGITAKHVQRACKQFGMSIKQRPKVKQTAAGVSERIDAIEARLDLLTDRLQHVDNALQRFLKTWEEFTDANNGTADAA